MKKQFKVYHNKLQMIVITYSLSVIIIYCKIDVKPNKNKLK